VGQALLVVCVGGRHRLTKLSARMSKTIGELVEECRAERRGEQRLGGGPLLRLVVPPVEGSMALH
jgi:hypothetical protein